jgi:VCBS repeat-containing protein
MSNRIVFIDSHIANHQSLIAQLPQGTQAIILDAYRDGIEQILVALQGKANLDAIDILSHGSPGTITLGSGVLNNDNLDDYAEQLTQIGKHLNDDGDILLYGCEVAKGKQGQAFIEQLSLLTGADVAASTTLTGAIELGGDWMLGSRVGTIQAKALQLSYEGVLVTYSGDFGNNKLIGALDDDTFIDGAGNDTLIGGGGTDTVVFPGNRSDYVFEQNELGQLSVRDINLANGNNGTDVLLNVERASFDDGLYGIAFQAGGTFRVNTYDGGYQIDGNVAKLPNGQYIMTWLSNQDNVQRLWAQRYDSNFVMQGDPFMASGWTVATPNNADENPDILYSNSKLDASFGNYTMIWASANSVYYQKYDQWGNTQYPVGSEPWFASPAGPLTDFSIIPISSTDYVGLFTKTIYGTYTTIEGWTESTESHQVYLKFFDQSFNGIGNASKLVESPHYSSHTPNSIVAIDTARLSNGNTIIAYTDGQASSNIRIYDSARNLVKQTAILSSGTDGIKIIPLNNGYFEIIYSGNIQRFDNNGTAQGLPQYVGVMAGNHIEGVQLSNGNFVVLWNKHNSYGYGNNSGYGQLFSSSGNKLGSTFAIGQYVTSVEATTNGGFIVNYIAPDQWDKGVYAKRYDANGNPIGPVINTTLLNAAPTDIILNNSTVNENSPPGTQIGTLISVDAHSSSGFTYTLVGGTGSTDNASFTINGDRLLLNTAVNYEVKNAYSVRIRTTDPGGLSYEEAFTISINNVNEAPTGINLSNNQINENSTIGTQVGTLASVDVDNTTGFTYSLVSGTGSTDNASFTISGDKLLLAVSPDYETKNSYSVRVKTTDSGGLSYQEAFTIQVKNANDQSNSAVEALSDGGFIMTWESADGDGKGIYARRYDRSGAKSGLELKINTNTQNEQIDPAITHLNDGGYLVTWSSFKELSFLGWQGMPPYYQYPVYENSYGIYGQLYNANGTVHGGEFQLNGTSLKNQTNSAVTVLSNDTFVVTWQSADQDGSGQGIYARIFYENGTEKVSEFKVNTVTLNDQTNPAIEALADGGFIISWESAGQDGSGKGIYVQRYDSSGAKSGTTTELKVNSYTNNDQIDPTITVLNDDGYLVTWASYKESVPTGGGSLSYPPYYYTIYDYSYGIYGQLYNANGTVRGGEFQLNQMVIKNQTNPAVTGLSNGTFVATWQSTGQDGSGEGIYARIFNANGTPKTSEFRVNVSTLNDQTNPAITALDDGDFVISWESADQNGHGEGVYARRYDSEGNPIQLVGSSGPTDISLSNDHIDENNSIGAPVGTLNTIDVDSSTGFSYQLVSGTGDSDNASFVIANDKLLLNIAADFEIKDSYSVRIRTTDMDGLSHEEAMIVHIDDANDAPNADPDTVPFLATEAGGVNNGTAGANVHVAASGVLSNDNNGGDLNDPLKVAEVSFYNGINTQTAAAGVALPGLYGTLTLNADGSYSYVVDNAHAAVQGLHTSSDTLTETFSYTMRDQNGAGLSSTSTLTITIEGANDAPVARNDGGDAREAGVVSGQDATGNVLTNDTDVDNGDSKTVTNDGVYVGDYGTLRLYTDGSYRYAVDNTDPRVDALNVGDSLQDSFNYTVVDAQGATSTAQLTITIAGGNDAPVAGTDTVDTDQDSVINITVLTNDSDVDSSNLTVSLPGNTSTGGAAIAVNLDQTVQYDPQGVFDSLPQGASGSDSFGYTVHDNHPTEPGSSNGTVNLNIAGLNDAPQAQADTALTTENAAVTIDVLQNDSDVDNNDTKTLISVNVVNPANQGGSATINGNQVVWNPNLDFDDLKQNEPAQVTLTYTMQDSKGQASQADVTITVQGSNDAPQGALSGSLANGKEDEVYSITRQMLLDGFSDAEGDTLTIQNLTANHGVLNPVTEGWEFTPDTNYNGTVTLTYAVSDGQGGVTDTVTRSFNLTPVNDDPVAVADTLTTDEDQAATLNVVGNDDDIDGDALNVFTVTQGAHGAVTFAGGLVTYTPDQNYHGTDSFTYTVSDGKGGTDIETVQVKVNSVNDAPYVNAALALQSAMALDPFIFILPTDTFADVDGDSLSISVEMPAWLSFDSASQTFSGTPTNAEAGDNIVQVTATDPSGETAITGFTINVAKNLNGISSAVENAVPSPTGGTTGDGNGDGILDSQQSNVASVPIPNSTVWATFGAATGVVITNVQNQPLLNTPQKMDAPYGAFSFNLENLTPGTIVPMSIYLTGSWSNTKGKEWTNSDTGDVINGYWKQMPNQNWKNIATAMTLEGNKLRIDFTLTDGDWTDKDGLANGTIVDPGVIGLYNNAPVATDDDLGSVNEDGVLTFTLQDILGNDTDLDNESLTPSLVANPANGTLVPLEDGSFNYKPNANFHGTDSFTYQVNDGTENSNIATINILVNSVNDTPTGPTTGTLDNGVEDTVYPVLAATLLQGFSDVDTEDTLSVINLNSVNGTFAATTNGWDFTPTQDHNGLVTFTYQVSDGAGGIVDGVTRTFNLTPVNDKPAGSPAGELANGEEDKAYTILRSNLINGYSDVDNDELSVTNLTVNHGTLSVFDSVTNSWTFSPDPNYNGVVNLGYGISDGKGGEITGINRSFVLDPVNDTPKAGDDKGDVFEDATVTVSFDYLMNNDSDVDGTSKTIIGIDTTGTAGSVSIDTANRTITYRADADEFDLLVSGRSTIDYFKYILKGSSGVETTATVEISVFGVSDGNPNLLGTIKSDNLSGTSGEDRIKGDNGNDTIDGGEGADNVFGDNGDDILNGGNSIDNLFGGNGNDNLNGGNGNDWLAGERGNDSLTGGLGNDVFLFAQGGGIDTITDFTNGIDKIQIAADTGITAFGQLKITGGTVNGVSYSTITMGNGGQVTLTGVSTTQLDATDFIFPV